MEVAPAFAEFGEGDALDNLHDGFTDFFHHAADGATGFIRAGAFFVEAFADATDGRQGAFDVADDDGERDFLGAAGEAIAAGDAAFALDDAGGFEVVQDLFEETFGNVLVLRNRLDADDRLVVVQRQDEQGPQGVFAAHREFHEGSV